MLTSIDCAIAIQPSEMLGGKRQYRCGGELPPDLQCGWEIRDAGPHASVFWCFVHNRAVRVTEPPPPMGFRVPSVDATDLMAAVEQVGTDAHRVLTSAPPTEVQLVDYGEVLRGFVAVLDARYAQLPAPPEIDGHEPPAEWVARLEERALVTGMLRDELAMISSLTSDQVRARYARES